MARKTRQKRQTAKRETNWILIGGVVAVGVIALFALLFYSLQGQPVATVAAYCEENPDNCITSGNADAEVTVVEVSDYGCSHCKTFHDETMPLLQAQYVNTEQIHWIALPYALSSNTLPAANAAMCANEQDAYFEFSEALFAQQQTLASSGFPLDGMLQVADQVGLDLDPFAQCVQEGQYNQVVSENVTAAREAGVSATPTFFVNDRMLEGAYPFSVFQQRIDTAMN